MLPLNEIFPTIQGEGRHTGTPSVFVRFQGCPVGCSFCDTKHTWELTPENNILNLKALATKGTGTALWGRVAESDLLDQIVSYHPTHVVLTGGEPAMYDLTTLCFGLHERGRSTQIETSGTFPVRVHANTWVTVSPKLDMPGGYRVRDDVLTRADEIKMPIGKTDDIAALCRLLNRGMHRLNTRVWVQPLSLNRKATDLCLDAALHHGWQVSLQTHALAGIR
jgi:7-carboxy-7-deazaguanine synthase